MRIYDAINMENDTCVIASRSLMQNKWRQNVKSVSFYEHIICEVRTYQSCLCNTHLRRWDIYTSQYLKGVQGFLVMLPLGCCILVVNLVICVLVNSYFNPNFHPLMFVVFNTNLMILNCVIVSDKNGHVIHLWTRNIVSCSYGYKHEMLT